MASLSKSTNTFNPLSAAPSDEDSEYKGKIYFNKKTVAFPGATLQLKNVSKFEQYGIKYINRVSTILLIISVILAFIGLFYTPYGLILTLLFGLISYIGIKERMRPKLYGLTIELNSGTRHNFLSKDSSGILALFDKLSYSIENEETFVVSFIDNRVTIKDSNIGIVGDNATSIGTSFS